MGRNANRFRRPASADFGLQRELETRAMNVGIRYAACGARVDDARVVGLNLEPRCHNMAIGEFERSIGALPRATGTRHEQHGGI